MKQKKQIFPDMKLKHQIIMLTGIAAGTLLIFLVVYTMILTVNSRKDRQTYVESSVNQLVTELDTFDSEMKNVITTFAFNRDIEDFAMSRDLGERYIVSQDINLIIDSIRISNPRIENLIFTDMGQVLLGTPDSTMFQLLRDLKEEKGWENSDELTYMMRPDGSLFCISKSFYNYNRKTQYYVIAGINMRNLEMALSGMDAFEKTFFEIRNREGDLITASGEVLKVSAGRYQEYEGKTVVQAEAASGLWEVRGMALPSGISKNIKSSRNIMAAIVAGMSLALCIIGYLIYKGIASPVESMIQFMDQYGKFYNKQRLPVRGSNEIARICDSVNKMLDNLQIMTRKIVNTQEQLYLAELAKKQAELTALQIQMNPHFLYNTLDCIRGMALVKHVPEIAEIATAMSKILRYSIKSEEKVVVRQETASIRDYLKIIDIRHQHKYEMTVEIEERIEELEIPKMILQPIVENAVFYGLEKQSGNGSLTVKGYQEEDSLLFVVENSGESISDETVKELSKVFEENKNANSGTLFSDKKSIGLKNIDKRLKLLYGEAYGLSIEKRKQGGTKAVVKVPVLRTENIRD